MKTCINCGSKEYNGFCTNCDEEVFIAEQYHDLDIPLPPKETQFMQNYKKAMLNNKDNKEQEGDE